MENQTINSVTERQILQTNNGEKDKSELIAVERNHTTHEKRLLPPFEEACAYEDKSPGTIDWLKMRSTEEQLNRHLVNLEMVKNDPHYVTMYQTRYIVVAFVIVVIIAGVLFYSGQDLGGFGILATALFAYLMKFFNRK